MDYCKLSDFEINKAVAEIAINGDWLLEPTDESPSWFFNHGVQGKNTVKLPDYCNNPADAWPIIAESKISIMWMTEEKQWCAWANGELEEGCWEWKYCPDDYSHDDNPLRAAMTVFLMMQESANVQDGV